MLNSIPDHRKRHTYEVAEILSAGILMFVLRCESRNQADQLAGQQFEQNYLKVFGMRLPITDTVHDFLEQLDPKELEFLRESLVRKLMVRKVFEQWKFQGYYNLTFDATGTHVFDEEPFEGCPYKETKNDMKWYVSVLEAKLVFTNGFSISLARNGLKIRAVRLTNRIVIGATTRRAAFKRLVKKVKTAFPRLAIVVTADGLYCCEPVFKLIKECGWKFIFTFTDDSLKSLWRTINKSTLNRQKQTIKKLPNGKWIVDEFSWINDLPYKDQQVNFITYQQYEDQQIVERHVHLANLTINEKNAKQISEQGRLRWNIENQGFNAQKNHGFALEHKYARKGFNTMKNYYLLMQIAHMISQLVEKTKSFQQALNYSGRTIRYVIKDLIAMLTRQICSPKNIHRHYRKIKQLRY